MNSIKKHPLIWGFIGIIVIIIVIIIAFGSKGPEEQTMIVHRADYTNTVAVSGKVVAAQNSDLGFDQSGRVATISAAVGDKVKVGTVIASIDNAAIRADLAQKQATLEKEQAKLAALRRGTRTEELAVSEQKYLDASSALIIALRNAYTQTEGAILTKADTLFNNGNSVNPTLNINAQSDTQKRAIELERIALGDTLATWRSALATLTAGADAKTLASVRTKGTQVMAATKLFIDHLATITNNLNINNAGVSQATIDTYRSTINAAAQQIGTTASTEQESYSVWTSSSKSLTLDQSGSATEDITAQAAQVRSAEADVANAQAQLRKTLIVAPFDGSITKMDLKIGEIASPNTSKVSMMSTNTFEIDSYIPEVYIARVTVGNTATLTLDAFGSERTFNASVISIEPAETVKDGVSTYKTKLRLVDGDPQIRSGMTANIQIVTEIKEQVIAVPQGVIISADGSKYVEVKRGAVNERVPVTLGGTAGFGHIEVISGLQEGDIVVLPPVTTN